MSPKRLIRYMLHEKDRFKRTKQGMLNFKEEKDLQFTMNKRCLQEDYGSLPLGYTKIAC